MFLLTQILSAEPWACLRNLEVVRRALKSAEALNFCFIIPVFAALKHISQPLDFVC